MDNIKCVRLNTGEWIIGELQSNGGFVKVRTIGIFPNEEKGGFSIQLLPFHPFDIDGEVMLNNDNVLAEVTDVSSIYNFYVENTTSIKIAQAT